ncbi:hypothetical protein MSAN_02118300 [Mycena sanguinolenta]|uniref:F-box domain-containing protein n=1 Tax=Mycena sanguinolenta TaxID=230812 RepID=A0A8H7CMN5_9AGAR|nr:hypothetical protein MSAN_02118300 [Mycena sanguinolenta]
MDISHWLPNELLLHIIQHTPKADQAALSRVAKRFHELCLPALNREVELKDSRFIASFCSGIIDNPSRADAVRSFNITVDFSEIRRDLILETLKLMSRLEYLSLSRFMSDDHHNRILLEECNFPQLISCNLSFPTSLSDLTALFLTRHPTLKRVHLRSDPRMVASQSPRISLPNLEFYAGQALFIPRIDAVRLKVELDWSHTDDPDVNKIMTRISSMTNPKLPFVSSSDNHHQIVISVSTHMPHTRTLRLRRSRMYFFFSSVNHDEDMIYHITECLPGFTNLVYLAIDWVPHQSKAENWSAVERLVEACPTLEACYSNRYAWRKVNGRWEECELEEFEVLAGPPNSTDY